MDMQPATNKQIEAFHKGASVRFAERNVAPEIAGHLFHGYMGKAASALGFVDSAKAARVDNLATKIAAAIGRQRG